MPGTQFTSLHLAIIIGAIAILFIMAPFVLSFRLKKLGSAVASERPAGAGGPKFSSWVSVKGQTLFTKQAIVSKMNLYDDSIGLRPMWGPERFIGLAEISEVEKLMSAGKTTRFVLKANDKGRLSDVTISGVSDPVGFVRAIESVSQIKINEMEDRRGMLDFLK
jgi:hypothetical protein